MSVDAAGRLEELARTDPSVAPLAVLEAEAFRAVAQGGWDAGLPELDGRRLRDGAPLLHGITLGVDVEGLRVLFGRLTGRLHAGIPHEDRAALCRLTAAPAAELLDLFSMVLAGDDGRLEHFTAEADVEPGLLETVVGLAALPLLLACGERAAPLLREAGWDAGSCPVCAAWPALAELRGLEGRRWLRCGRCAAAWTLTHEGCAFCDNRDFTALGYLAPEDEAESRRAATCARCHLYLKSFAVLGPLDRAEVRFRDLTSQELDMAAIEAGYAPPVERAFPLDVRLTAIGAPARNARPDERRGRLPWRRR